MVNLIMQELQARGINNKHTLAYQNQVGPIQWLKPYTDETLIELGQIGVKSLLAVPVRYNSIFKLIVTIQNYSKKNGK
ncbi:hypothetical protein Ahy_B01g052748 isoform B [Arachis hypogaea]|uniref:Uncharacterized protein n=1 Tax=Arachis hypogaea TaxID=3818 RepID=A0A445AQ90_ARAHY|nr:hypothetical protein Ahy_B01g052748 isoform B [Arachis hypogaea]